MMQAEAGMSCAGSLLPKILEWDRSALLALNGAHTPWLDPVMMVLSSYWGWGTVCAVVVLWMAFGRRDRFVLRAGVPGRYAALFLLGSLGVNSLLTNLVKVLVQRPRPIHEEALAPVIHALEKYEGSYSFFSAHSSNSFCLAVFVLLCVRNRLYGCGLLGWAAAVSYSRIYVGKHYPLDVLCGLLFGSLIGWLGYLAYRCFSSGHCVGRV